jgi:hypothetical protein
VAFESVFLVGDGVLSLVLRPRSVARLPGSCLRLSPGDPAHPGDVHTVAAPLGAATVYLAVLAVHEPKFRGDIRRGGPETEALFRIRL